METKINKINLDLFENLNTADLYFKQYALEDTLVGSTIRMFRTMKGVNLGDFSLFCEIELTRLKDIENEVVEPLVSEVERICNCLGIPFNVLVLNAILNGNDFDTQFNADLAKDLRPIIHKMTKIQFINESDPLDYLELTYN